jgi:small subunit ribosomal protein S20
MQDPVANIKSQIKRIKTNEKRRLRNKAAKSEIKTRIKRALSAAEAGQDNAPDLVRAAVKKLDKAVARGIIHRNQAANRKSALMAKVARLVAEHAAPEAGGEPDQQHEPVPALAKDSSAVRGGTGQERARRRAIPSRPRRGRRGHEPQEGTQVEPGAPSDYAGGPEAEASEPELASAGE